MKICSGICKYSFNAIIFSSSIPYEQGLKRTVRSYTWKFRKPRKRYSKISSVTGCFAKRFGRLSESGRRENMKPNYETCQHVESVGTFAVYVTPDCPNYHRIKGQLVTTRRCCQVCDYWRRRNGNKGKSIS